MEAGPPGRCMASCLKSQPHSMRDSTAALAGRSHRQRGLALGCPPCLWGGARRTRQCCPSSSSCRTEKTQVVASLATETATVEGGLSLGPTTPCPPDLVPAQVSPLLRAASVKKAVPGCQGPAAPHPAAWTEHRTACTGQPCIPGFFCGLPQLEHPRGQTDTHEAVTALGSPA